MAEARMVPGFEHRPGNNCESTALRNLLWFEGIDVSEPMIFGLGEGLHFIYWQMKSMDFVFTGGRTKPDLVYRTFASNVELELTEHKTASAKQASDRLFQSLDSGQPMMLRMDALYLDYFDIDIHFPAHYAVAAGYDGESVYLADTHRPGLQKTSRASLAEARASTASMGMGRPNHQSVALHEPGRLTKTRLKQNLRAAIRRNADAMLTPPIKNIGVKGIALAGQRIPTWIQKSGYPQKCLQVTADIWERGGTGGGLFRKMYSAFLAEAGQLLGQRPIQKAADSYRSIAQEWTALAALLEQTAVTLDQRGLDEVGRRVGLLAKREAEVLSTLL